MAGIKTGKSGYLPRNFSFLFDLDDLRYSKHLIEIPPLDRLEYPYQLLAGDQIAVAHPVHAFVQRGHQFAWVKASQRTDTGISTSTVPCTGSISVDAASASFFDVFAFPS